jgi:TM2 domain-containing membrane protein YozV
LERKSVWWAYGFLLFFGAFGVHRFYLDRPVSGVLYFLTAGFAGIGIVYDIFAMPFLVASANQ